MSHDNLAKKKIDDHEGSGSDIVNLAYPSVRKRLATEDSVPLMTMLNSGS